MFEQVYESQGVECDGLYMLGPGSGIIWRCGLFGVCSLLGAGVLLWGGL